MKVNKKATLEEAIDEAHWLFDYLVTRCDWISVISESDSDFHPTEKCKEWLLKYEHLKTKAKR